MTRISAPTEPSPGRPRRDRQGGFTLMEVILALTVAGMLATLAVPYFRIRAGEGAMIQSANAIASLLRRDRNMALHLRRVSKVLVDTKRGSIRSVLLGQSVLVPDGIKLLIYPENAQDIAFASDGSASGTRLVLAAQRASFAIDVNRLTAAINVSRLEP